MAFPERGTGGDKSFPSRERGLKFIRIDTIDCPGKVVPLAVS